MKTISTPVLSNDPPKSSVMDVTLVFGGAAALAVASQLLIPLWFTPVPISLATFTVLVLGATFGPARAGLSVGLYLALGVSGLPVFAGFTAGVMTASFGYVVGYLAAAVAVGELVRSKTNRNFIAVLGIAVLGSAIVYLFGVPWLMLSLGVSFVEALALGVAPFLVGDILKTVLASLLFPWASTLVNGHRG